MMKIQMIARTDRRMQVRNMRARLTCLRTMKIILMKDQDLNGAGLLLRVRKELIYRCFDCHCSPSAVSREPDLSRIEGSDLEYIVQTQSGCLRNAKGTTFIGYLKDREMGYRRMKPKMTDISVATNRANLGSCILPNKRTRLDHYTHKAFCGSYSKEGDFFMTSSQDHMIRMYDTSRDNFQLTKTFRSQQIGWSVLDTDISPDGRHFTYSGWSPCRK